MRTEVLFFTKQGAENMEEQKYMLLSCSNDVSRNIGKRRMTLAEFNEWIQDYIDALTTTQKALATLNNLFGSERRIRRLEYKNIVKCIIAIGDDCNKFYESIERSASFPLAVVPFILPLLLSLKKIEAQIHLLKKLFEKEQEVTRTEHGHTTERQEEVANELETLHIMCEEVLKQVRFLQHQARFQEKSILNHRSRGR